jgi:hypothetical protein
MNRNPIQDEIIEARLSAGLSKNIADTIMHCTPHEWRQFEDGSLPMHPAIWELFQIKVARL